MPVDAFRLYEVAEAERAHYNRLHFDVQVNMESLGGFREVGGVHYRTTYDLARHEEHSKDRLTVFFNERRFIPHVLELSFGIDRNVWALLDLFYEAGDKAVLRLPRRLAPFACAVFPLVNKDGLPERAREVFGMLRPHLDVLYDASGSIGRRYARQDEIGTPYCVTVDHDSLAARDVTLRDRDSKAQVRVPTADLRTTVGRLLEGALPFADLRGSG